VTKSMKLSSPYRANFPQAIEGRIQRYLGTEQATDVVERHLCEAPGDVSQGKRRLDVDARDFSGRCPLRCVARERDLKAPVPQLACERVHLRL
jgi:hypothetical protein